MYPGEFENLFRKIVKIFTLGSIAKNEIIKGKLLKRNPETPLWDTIEDIKGFDGIDLENGKYVSAEYFFKKPIRISFFILIHEMESRLYRIQQRRGLPLKEIDEMNINDLIRRLLKNEELIKLQEIYSSRAEFKEDLKAISAFRNIIVHTNKKLLKNVDVDTLITRKKQVLKLLSAIQQILDRMRDNN